MKTISAKILLAIFTAGILTGCGKTNENSKPVLKLKSVSGNVIPINGTLVFQFEVTDKEGDISDTLFLKKVRLNRKVTPTIRDSFFLRVPAAPNSPKGTIELNLSYQNFLISGNPPAGVTPENDTLRFKVALHDKARNVSDTFTSDPIVILRQ